MLLKNLPSLLRQTPQCHALPITQRLTLQRFTTATAGTDGEQRIARILTDSLKPERLLVKDISGGCGAMYAVQIASSRFKGLSLVKQHQLVVKAIDAEIKNAHGIQIKTEVPE
ncbi:hypothetical protein HDU97_009363 [Phlyctochytrium planicorne]|nr:hypothetical protein HDU97_009363 [Phlyctochytrium planicorne]